MLLKTLRAMRFPSSFALRIALKLPILLVMRSVCRAKAKSACVKPFACPRAARFPRARCAQAVVSPYNLRSPPKRRSVLSIKPRSWLWRGGGSANGRLAKTPSQLNALQGSINFAFQRNCIKALKKSALLFSLHCR